MGKRWDRLKAAAHQAGTPPLPDPGDLGTESETPGARKWRERHEGRPVSAASTRSLYPETAPLPTPPHVWMDAGALLREGDPVAVGFRDVKQPDPGRHAWVVAIWYQVDPLQLQDGGQFQMLPDQVLGTLPPACYFCEVPWTFEAMRVRCPGRPPKPGRY